MSYEPPFKLFAKVSSYKTSRLHLAMKNNKKRLYGKIF